ncbi:hypothetical protein KJ951_01945, partial [Patescibacteria group bacterium]|nr:hypothetical protein [Patescibacteria group bacterium]MBU1703142.1 hypothetical protein [Patescibacteria group bacterium]MBU1954144.1 hypothetical protein [Patescibacteria group bacterium]
MPTRKQLSAVLTALLLFLLLPADVSFAAINEQIPFIGTLEDSTGTPVADGNYNIEFTIYDAAAAGTCLYTASGLCVAPTQLVVPVTSGKFSVILGGPGTNSISALDYNVGNLYLGIRVAANAEMTPRYRLGASAYSFNAETVDGISAAAVATPNELLALDASGDFNLGTGDINATDATLIGNVSLGDAATDTLTIAAVLQGGSPLVFEGATADAFETTFTITDPTADRTITFQDGTGTVAFLSDITVGANVALSNLVGVAINTSLLSDTTNTDDLGSDALNWKNLYLGGSIFYEGATDDAFETTISVTDPTADRTITIPNASGTIAVSATGPVTLSAAGDIGFDQTANFAWTGIHDYTGATYAGASPLVLEGATADAFETTIAVTDPTADRTITVPDGSGTLAFTGDSGAGYLLDTGDTGTGDYDFTGAVLQGGSPLVFEGTTADAFESTFAFTDPTADRTITFQDASGTVAFTTDIPAAQNLFETIGVPAGTAPVADNATDTLNFVAGSANFTITGSAVTDTVTFDIADNYLYNTGDTGTGTYDFTGAEFAGASPFVLEGATADGFETTIAVTDPTADRTITIQDASGTVAFTSDIPGGAGLWEAGANGTYEDDAATIIGPDVAETLSNAGFALAGNNDLFVGDMLGVEGNIYTDGGLDVVGTTTLNGATTLGDAADDVLTATGTWAGASPFVLEGATADGFETTISVTDPTADRTITVPNVTGTLVTTGDTGSVTGTMISDGSVDISDDTNLVAGTNISLAGDTLNVDDAFLLNTGDTGTGDYDFTGAVLQGLNALVFEGATADAFETIFAFTDPTADRTITFQDASGTVAFTSDIPGGAGLWEVGANGTYEDDAATIIGPDVAETLSNAGFALAGNNDLFVGDMLGVEGSIYTDGGLTVGASTTYGDGDIESSGTLTINNTNNQAITTGTGLFTTAGDLSVIGYTTLGDTSSDRVTVNGVLQGAIPLYFEGATGDGFEVFFAVTDPTADRTITLPNASGTVAVSATGPVTLSATGAIGLNQAANFIWTGIHDYTGATYAGASPIVFEGATADPNETTFAITDPTADNVITFQDASGTVAFTADIPAGAALWEVGANGTYEDDAATIVGPDVAETLSNAGFTLAGNNDLFVGDMLGVEGNIYTDGDIYAVGSANSSTQVLSSSGSAAVAAISWSGDGNTGIFSPAADTVALTTNGTERMRFNPDGTISIGVTASPLIFEGATADAFESTFAFIDPTADRTITFQDASGTVAFTSDIPAAGANTALSNLAAVAINTSLLSDTTNTDDLGSDALNWRNLYLGTSTIYEGATDDGFETTISVTDPTADRTITVPNVTGTLVT